MFKKFSKFFYAKQQIILLALAFVLLVVVVLISVYNFSFLISSFNKAFGTLVGGRKAPIFDISGFEKLNLIK